MTCKDTIGLPLVHDKYFVMIETYKAYFEETIRV